MVEGSQKILKDFFGKDGIYSSVEVLVKSQRVHDVVFRRSNIFLVILLEYMNTLIVLI